ncbi:antibiotic biosynthesis monooxygenase family protein [Shewanella sp. 125m-7]
MTQTTPSHNKSQYKAHQPLCANKLQSIQQAQFIRMVNYSVPTDNEAEFINQQANQSSPLMASVAGMLGGFLMRTNLNGADRLTHREFVLITYWDNQQTHQNYLQHVLANSKVLPNKQGLIETSLAHEIHVAQGWQVN